MKKIFLYLTFFCFWYVNIFAKKINQSIFPLYKQCNNPIEIFAETEKLDYSSENATIKTTQITSKGKGFLHTLMITPKSGTETTIIFDTPIKVAVVGDKDEFSASKTFALLDVPSPSFEVKNTTNGLEINTIFAQKSTVNTFKNILPDDSQYFVEFITIMGKNAQGKKQTLKLENKNKSANFLAKLPDNFVKGQEILVKLENINRINAQKEVIPVNISIHHKNFKVKI